MSIDSVRAQMNQFFPPPSVRKARGWKADLGQFYTPDSVAAFMAGLFTSSTDTVRLLDPGAGKGALTAAFIGRWGAAASIDVDAVEIDEHVVPELRETAARLGRVSVVAGDFVERGAAMRERPYTHAILNPPYRKIGTASDYRARFRAIGLETVNLYSGFVGLALSLLEDGGELVAIIPRSFCNGPYYEPFRRFVMERAAIRHIHLFFSRNKAFREDGVLQENVIIRLVRGAAQEDVVVSTSADDTFEDHAEVSFPFDKIVLPGDERVFIHIPTAEEEETGLLDRPVFRHRLEDVGLSVSTGPVVDFRLANDLRADPEPGTVPLLYAGHFTRGGLEWPKAGFKKPNAIRLNRATQRWLFPPGCYAIVRRFSSKEERRRVVAYVLESGDLEAPAIGFENHLNVIHHGKKPIAREVAHGVATYLNSTVVDLYVRRFNGHTQVNATDLRNLPFPSRKALTRLGEWALCNPRASQEAIDGELAKLA